MDGMSCPIVHNRLMIRVSWDCSFCIIEGISFCVPQFCKNDKSMISILLFLLWSIILKDSFGKLQGVRNDRVFIELSLIYHVFHILECFVWDTK